ncbi:MAG: hypothetical protein AAGD86_00330 [Pseudomonadota bacterium]
MSVTSTTDRRARPVVRLLGVSLGLLLTADALACRCAPRGLADYYAEADEVVIALLTGATDAAKHRELALKLLQPPFKASPLREAGLATGDTVAYATGLSTAACGLTPESDAVYVLFARDDPDRPGRRLVNTCDGSRLFRRVGGEPQGFDDVPARFVVSQLDALAAMDVLGAVAANAPRAGVGDALIGLLDIKSLAHGGVVPVHADPDARAPCLARVDAMESLATREAGYEFAAAVVLARRDGWYRVRLADGRPGWIAAEHAGTYFPYNELPVRRLAYLNEHWSGLVWPEPGAGQPRRSGVHSSQARSEFPVEVHESRELGGLVWFRVSVLVASPCEGGDGKATLSGWVPGYGANGQPTVWYYSRGC